jgi:hypothetical protein
MAKDSYWFKHDASAGRGTRLRKLTFIYGHWAKGIYWDVIEQLREQSNYTYPKDEHSLQMLCDLIGCKDFEKFSNWLNDSFKLNLLQSNESSFYSEKLIEIMNEWEKQKNNGVKGGRPTKNKPKINPNENPINNPTHNPNETIREEYIRKEEIIINNVSFEKFFDKSLQLPYIIKNGKRFYGNDDQLRFNGMSEFAIKKHLEDCRINLDTVITW